MAQKIIWRKICFNLLQSQYIILIKKDNYEHGNLKNTIGISKNEIKVLLETCIRSCDHTKFFQFFPDFRLCTYMENESKKSLIKSASQPSAKSIYFSYQKIRLPVLKNTKTTKMSLKVLQEPTSKVMSNLRFLQN